MSWKCSVCQKEEDDSVECLMNLAAGTHRHLYQCKKMDTFADNIRKVVKEIEQAERQKVETDPTIYNQGLRESAEKNRRGLEILKQKSEQHGAQVCTISGKPPDPDYAELHNAPQPVKGNGQHADYYVLCEEERRKGFVRPVRQEYTHSKCHTKTYVGLSLAETYARDPKFYGATFCVHCGGHYPVAEFKWLDGEVLGS